MSEITRVEVPYTVTGMEFKAKRGDWVLIKSDDKSTIMYEATKDGIQILPDGYVIPSGENGEPVRVYIKRPERPRDRDAELNRSIEILKGVLDRNSCPVAKDCMGTCQQSVDTGGLPGKWCRGNLKQHIIETAQKGGVGD